MIFDIKLNINISILFRFRTRFVEGESVRNIIALICMLMVCSCAKINLVYQPQSTSTISGNLSIGSFGYTVPSGCKDNEILGASVKFENDRSISSFFRDAIIMELKLSGLSIGQSSCLISGNLDEIYYDGWGFSEEFYAKARFEINKNSKNIYSSCHESRITVTKTFGGGYFMPMMSKVVSDIINKMISSKEFEIALRKCEK
ncbi:hypothetical protein [Desulfocurvus sp. DL9XJH121]